MPPLWQPAALAALRLAGPPWLAVARLVRRVSEVGERCWSVALLESRGALPGGSRRRRHAHFHHARFATGVPEPVPGALLAIGGGGGHSLLEMLWVEVASPVTSLREGRAFLDDCERALDEFVPEPIVPIDPGLAATFHGYASGDRWAGVLFPLPAQVEDAARAHFAGDDPEDLSIERELVVSLPDLRDSSQACIAFGVLVRDAAVPHAAAFAVETDESTRALFLLRARAAMTALASAAPAASASETPDRTPDVPRFARLDTAPRVALRLLTRPESHVAHARIESVVGPAALLRVGDFVTVCANDDSSRDALARSLTPLARSGLLGAVQGESALAAHARRRLLHATLTPSDAPRWSLSDPIVREQEGAGVLLPSLSDLGAGALDPARLAFGEGGSAAAAVETPGAGYDGDAGVVVWITGDGGLHWHPLPTTADQAWNPLRRCRSWPPSWLDRISLSGGTLAIEWEDPWMFEQPTRQWRAAFDPAPQRWHIQRCTHE